MEIGYGIPNGLHENIEDGKDIKMSEFEEGELVEMISKTELGENSDVVSKIESQETSAGTGDVFDKDYESMNQNRRKNRKNIEDGKDIKMSEFEEGELVDMISKTELGENSAVVSKIESQETSARTKDVFDKVYVSKNQKRRKNRKKKKNNEGNKSTPGPNITDINRFVTNVCKRLREKKSYLMWHAVACLGVSVLSDLVKEVEAIQACGGQKTADGRRFRVGGGILWNILKKREPKAYKEIMKRGKEFEKQLKQVPKTPLINQEAKDATSQNTPGTVTDKPQANASDGSSLLSNMVCDSQEESTSGPKRQYVYSRIRMPVSYDDLFGEGCGKDVQQNAI